MQRARYRQLGPRPFLFWTLIHDRRLQVPDLAPGAFHRAEETVRRSRFIVTMARVSSPEEAKAFIDRIREEHAGATHNCWAYNAGAPGDTAQVGASDDGEPKGTAGRPMLTALLHSDVGEVAAVVTRYFGGILLGTGGLVRAYQGSVKLGLEGLPVTLREDMSPLRGFDRTPSGFGLPALSRRGEGTRAVVGLPL